MHKEDYFIKFQNYIIVTFLRIYMNNIVKYQKVKFYFNFCMIGNVYRKFKKAKK